MPIRPFRDKTPVLGERCYVDEGAHLIGDVVLGDDASLWPGVVVRGDVNHIRIGARSNIQDGSVLHVTHDGEYSPGGFPLTIGEDVTVGHKVILHGCQIADYSLIGMNAVILNNVKIGRHCLIGAGTLIPEGREIPDGSLVMGVPGKVVRQLTPEQCEGLESSAARYVENARRYAASLEVQDD